MGLMKLRSMWKLRPSRVIVTPSRQTDLNDGPRTYLRCGECDWSREECPIAVAPTYCPRCNYPLSGDGT